MLSLKTLDQVRHHVLMGGLPGPILVVYPMIPKKVYSAKKSYSVDGPASAAAPSILDGQQPASGGDDDSSNDDTFNEEGQLPEVLTRGTTLMTAWQRAAALAKDHFTIGQPLGQHDLTKFYPISITIAHKAEEGKRLSDKEMLLMPATDHGGNAKEPFAGGRVPQGRIRC